MFQNVHHIESYSDKILTEQIKILYRTLLPIILVNFVVSSAFLYGLWNVTNRTSLITWYSLILIFIVIRTSSYFIYYKPNFSPDNARRYGLHYAIGSFISGALWGIGAVLLFPEQHLEYQLFILFVLAVMAAGSVSSLTIYLPVFLAYLPVSLLPLAFWFLIMDSTIHVSLGVMSFAYLFALVYFGINFNRSLVQTLTLRFHNNELVEQLTEQKNKAEQANLDKSKFLAAASHDLRQPLHSLTLFTSVLNEYTLEPKLRNVANKISLSVQALQGLFNALLDISRLDAGVLRVNKTDFYLKTLFDNLANDFNEQVYKKNLEIVWPSTELSVYTDYSLLDQILRNYLSNAIRYTKRGEITISAESQQHGVTIKVKDTGIGIAMSDQQAIFKEFHQLNNPERDRTKGLGLGLAIVQRTATLLGHAISVESSPGEGATFTITVQQALSTHNSPPSDQAHGDSNYLSNALIVVIDDEADILEGTRTLLEQWGCRVITATDSESALQQLYLAGKPPDGIIADYRLRNNRTGISAIHDILTRYDKEIHALIVTGDIEIAKLQDVSTSGFQMLHKPVSPLKLKTFIRHIKPER